MEPIKKIVKQANTQIEKEREQFARKLGITGVQMSVIDFLSNCPNNEATQNAIEHEFNIKRSTTTTMVQRMEKHGLISRLNVNSDRRQKNVRLTLKAENLVPQIKHYMAQDDQKLRKHFSAQELKETIKVLQFIMKGDS